MASSERAIGQAQEAGAQNVPQATLQLQLATEERQKAVQLSASGEQHRADLMFARAEADADLAVAYAHASSAQQGAAQANQQVQDLQKAGAQ